MYNQEKVQMVKKVGTITLCIILVLSIFFAGFGVGTSKQKRASKPVKQEKVVKNDTLGTDAVNQFLVAYYTKKDLGENRNRYQPLVTTAMYRQLTNEEKQPVNQAYKGYIVNQVFDQAQIFINEKDNSAICVVTYKNTQRMKKGNDEGAIKNESNQDTVKITFLKQGKHFLVDKMESIGLSDPTSTDDNSYKNTDAEKPTNKQNKVPNVALPTDKEKIESVQPKEESKENE